MPIPKPVKQLGMNIVLNKSLCRLEEAKMPASMHPAPSIIEMNRFVQSMQKAVHATEREGSSVSDELNEVIM